MDLCGSMRAESINEKRYALVVVDDLSAMRTHKKERVRTDNDTEFKNKTLVKFFDEAEAIATACFTQNRLIIHKCFDKTPNELMNKRKPNIKFFHVFECRCYLLNDYDDVEKLQAEGDIGVFVGYSKESAAFRFTTNELIRYTRA
nr:integrase, catalytic region, zinc finger, CCHC-type, peptidase aspartic, catalytic [Tanacetum cinerariifolium]